MIPVYQTMTVANNGTGNCRNACIASLLELPLREVADILPTDPGDWSERWKVWLADRGLKLVTHPMGEDDDIAPRGFSIASVFTTRRYPKGHPRAGRNISHAVIAFDGQVVHDPFPLGGEVKRINYYETLEPMTECEKSVHRVKAQSGFCNHGYKLNCKAEC